MSPHSSSNTVANLSESSEIKRLTFHQVLNSIKGGFDKDDIDMAMNILKSSYYPEVNLDEFKKICMTIDKQQEETVLQRLKNPCRFIRVIGVIMDIKVEIRQGREPGNWFGSKSFAASEHIFEGEPGKPINLDEIYNTLVQTRPRDEEEFFKIFMTMVLVKKWKHLTTDRDPSFGIYVDSDKICDFMIATLKCTNVKISRTYQNDQREKIKEFIEHFQRVAKEQEIWAEKRRMNLEAAETVRREKRKRSSSPERKSSPPSPPSKVRRT